MALIHEEIQHPNFPMEIDVIEQNQDLEQEPWGFVQLSWSNLHNLHPEDLCQLGEWMIQQGTRLSQEYTPFGIPKAAAEQAELENTRDITQRTLP